MHARSLTYQQKYFTYHPTVMKTAPERARVASFNDCWMRHRHVSSWLGFLEIQDFVYSPRGIENITAALLGHKGKNSLELSVWPMQENDKQRLSEDHIRESKQLSNRLMLEKYQYRRDYPAGTRMFAQASVINFVGDSLLMDTNAKLLSPAKSDFEVLTYPVERDGFDSQDPHRWKHFPKPAQQLAQELATRLKSRARYE